MSLYRQRAHESVVWAHNQLELHTEKPNLWLKPELSCLEAVALGHELPCCTFPERGKVEVLKFRNVETGMPGSHWARASRSPLDHTGPTQPGNGRQALQLSCCLFPCRQLPLLLHPRPHSQSTPLLTFVFVCVCFISLEIWYEMLINITFTNVIKFVLRCVFILKIAYFEN